MWIGTNHGLNRYDGSYFKTFYYQLNDTNCISGNQVADIMQDKQGIFWIATKDGGLTRYDPYSGHNQQFKQYKHDPSDNQSIATNRLTCLFDYNDDYLLIGAETFPVIFLHKKSGKFTYWKDDYKPGNKTLAVPFGPATATERDRTVRSGNWLHKITRSSDGSIWMSLLLSYIPVKASNDSLFMHKWLGEAPLSVPDFFISGDTIWCASWKTGIYCIIPAKDKSTGTSYTVTKWFDLGDEVNHIAPYDDDWIIATTKKSGLWLVSRGTGKKIHYSNSNSISSGLISDKLTALYKDGNGIWWVGSKSGISKYNPALWKFTNTPIDKKLNNTFETFSIHQDQQGTLRLCTSNGIYKKAPLENSFFRITYPEGGQLLKPTTVFEYAPGKMLMGTELSIYAYDPKSEKITRLPEQFIKSDNNRNITYSLYQFDTYQVRNIICDTIDGHPVLIWSALGWGMGVYDLIQHNFEPFFYHDNVPGCITNNLARKVIKDKTGNIWVATAEGLFRWHKSYPPKNSFDAFRHIPGDSGSLPNNDILDMYVDENNHLWLATFGDGLCKFDGSRFHSYRSPLESSNVMFSIVPDQQNRLWISSADGFEIFDRVDSLYQHVKLPLAEWQLQFPSRPLTLNDGSICYVAENHLISFQPRNIIYRDVFPELFLTEFQIFRENHLYDLQNGKSTFRHNQNHINFQFAAPVFTNATPVLYRYILLENETSWSVGSSEGRAEYNNLGPGNYQFMVQVSNDLGHWSNPVTLATFIISPPYWKTWWFAAICLLAVSIIAYFIFRFRIGQLLKIQSIRNAIANDLHDEVGSALSTISLYTEVARLKDKNDTELDSILEKIAHTSQEMQENMHHIVWSLQPRNDAFNQVLMRLKAYVTELMQQKSVKTEFLIPDDLLSVKLSHEQRKEVFLVFKEAINNLLKYSSCTMVTISFSKAGKEMVMQISDNGKGFEPSEIRNGNGFISMQQRAKALKGTLNIISAEGNGTTVTLKFPLS